MTAPLPLTISERVRRMDAPTLPPRYAVFALYEGEDASRCACEDDPELALDLAAQRLAEAAESRAARISGAYDCTTLAVVERDRSLASIYEQRIVVRNDGSSVILPPVYVREAKWCACCERADHSPVDCSEEVPS